MSTFWKNVASVLTGTALAQAIPIIGMLVLARQYAPAEFGTFSVWLSIVLLLSVILTARFETALTIELDGEPRRLAVAATVVTTCLTACISVVILAIGALVFSPSISRFPSVLTIISIPTAFSFAATQIWQSWAAAEGAYRQLSLMRIAQAGSVTLIQIAAGLFYSSATALAMAYFFGQIIGLALSIHLMPIGKLPSRQFTKIIRDFWHRHRRFPQFSLPAAAINTAAAQLPVIIIASRFGSEIAGLLAMTIRALGAPIGLLGNSVLDVFKRHAAISFRERGECRENYIQTLKVLTLASFAFCAIIILTGEELFALAFGETWRNAGKIAIWLLPLFALRFIASPLSYVVYIVNRQHLDLIWQIGLLGMTAISLGITMNSEHALKLYSASASFMYILYIFMSYLFSQGTDSNHHHR